MSTKRYFSQKSISSSSFPVSQAIAVWLLLIGGLLFLVTGCQAPISSPSLEDTDTQNLLNLNKVQDPDTHITYAADALVLMFTLDVTEEEIQETVDYLQGTIISSTEEIQMYIVQLPYSSSLEEINNLAQEVEDTFPWVSQAGSEMATAALNN